MILRAVLGRDVGDWQAGCSLLGVSLGRLLQVDLRGASLAVSDCRVDVRKDMLRRAGRTHSNDLELAPAAKADVFHSFGHSEFLWLTRFRSLIALR